MQGNLMTMRESLVKLFNDLKFLSRTHNDDLPEDVRAILGRMAFEANEALSMPPRNCDVGKDVKMLLEEYIAMRGFTSDNQIWALYELALPVIEWCLYPAK